MSEIRKQKKIKGRSLPGLLPVQPTQLAGPASRRPSPPPSSVVFVLDRGRGVWPARARATAPRHLSPCLPALPSSLDAPDDAMPPPCSLSLALGSSLLSLALSLTQPNTTVADVRHSSRLRPPLAPPTSSEAPPRPPLPPHRSTAPRKPCIAATSPFPSSGSDHRRRRIRRLRRVPEPASTPTATAVSYATVSPSSPPRSLTVASSPPRPNLRRRRARRRRSSGDHLVTPASPTSSQDPVEHP